MNIFEGARRISVFAATIVSVVVLFFAITDKPSVSIDYSIDHPNGTPYMDSSSCGVQSRATYFTTSDEHSNPVYIRLCIKSMKFNNDERLIPYKVDDLGMVWGATIYSEEVGDYIKTLEDKFTLPLEDARLARYEAANQYKKDIKKAVVSVVIGLVVFFILIWAIGWIVRGFLGIPQGEDKKPNKLND